jgi:hypothetical protein
VGPNFSSAALGELNREKDKRIGELAARLDALEKEVSDLKK